MISPLADIVSILVCYLLLFLLQKEVVSTEEHSLPYRVVGFLCGWGLVFLLFDWFLKSSSAQVWQGDGHLYRFTSLNILA